MTHIVHQVKRNVTSTRFDVKVAQWILWSIALVMIVGAIYELTRFQLTEYQFFTGILLVLAVSLQVILGGLLLPIVQFVAQHRKTE
jgi:hypothetical protein